MEDQQRKYRPTVLNLFAGVILLSCIIGTITNYEELSKGEGWGMVGMFGLGGVGLTVFLIDFIIQRAFKDRVAVWIAGIVVLIATLFLFFI